MFIVLAVKYNKVQNKNKKRNNIYKIYVDNAELENKRKFYKYEKKQIERTVVTCYPAMFDNIYPSLYY